MCEKAVYEFCNKHKVKSCKLLLAVSGGSDSVALCCLIVSLKKQLSLIEVGIAHVNHGLRPEESKHEEEFVSQLAELSGCRFHVKKISRKNLNDSGVELWAREERYAFFRKLQNKHGYKFVATGHTANDQAETVLMRMYRGSGLTGLCGIKAVREDGIVRPLINLHKEELKAWLEKQGKLWCEDSSNLNLKYIRNYIRHRVIPAMEKREPKTVEYLAGFAEYIQEQMIILMPLINKWVAEHLIEDEPGRFVLAKPDEKHPFFPASEGIALLFRKHNIPFEKKHIVNFIKNVRRKSGCFLLKDGWKFFPGRDSVEIISEKEISIDRKNSSPVTLNVPGETDCKDPGYNFKTAILTFGECDVHYDASNNTAYIDFEKIGKKLLIREVLKTDTFKPLGFNRSINLNRFLKNHRISSFYRNSTKVLADNSDNIIWIPGVAIGHEFRVTEDTASILKISCQRIF